MRRAPVKTRPEADPTYWVAHLAVTISEALAHLKERPNVARIILRDGLREFLRSPVGDEATKRRIRERASE